LEPARFDVLGFFDSTGMSLADTGHWQCTVFAPEGKPVNDAFIVLSEDGRLNVQ
jgi:hypothetical protein